MAGPANQIMGEVIRPRFNVYTIMDHALGGYERGEDGLYYLNGGFAHIMGFSGRGNTFKTTLLDFCIFQIMLRYRAAWGSKYDTEVSAALDRLETGYLSAQRASGIDDGSSVLSLIDEGRYNLVASDVLPGEQYYSDYIRKEIEGRFKEYATKKNLRESPFRDPVRRQNKQMLDPWLYTIDSLSEFHTSDIEGKHAKTDVGDSDQNILNAHDSLQKSNMMGRWPAGLARGHMFMGFVVHLADDMGGAMKNGGKPSADKLLDDISGELKFSNVPRRAISFLTNSLIVATKTGELKADSSYDAKTATNEPMYPSARSRTMNSSSNDLKIIRYTQFRAKGGATGVKFELIFSQSQGFFYHLSLWHYISKTLSSDYGYTRTGANYELHLLPGVKFMRTTIRDMIDENPRLRRALEITAALAYMRNNFHTLELKYADVTPELLHKTIAEKGWDWDEIMDNTVEYWMFKDQEEKGGKRTLTAMSLLAMAVDDDCVPKFLTRKK